MRDVSRLSAEWELIDNFSIPVNLSSVSDYKEIAGSYGLATITVGYLLTNFNTDAFYTPLISPSFQSKLGHLI